MSYDLNMCNGCINIDKEKIIMCAYFFTTDYRFDWMSCIVMNRNHLK